MTQDKTDQDKPTEHEPDRQNGQGDHHGVRHTPDEFDALNPAKLDKDIQQKRT